MKYCLLLTASAIALVGHHRADAQVLDVFDTRGDVSEAPASPLLHGMSCRALPAGRPFELEDAIIQAICINPRVRQAWSEVREQAAALGVVGAAYLPTLSATAGIERDTLSTTYDYSALGSDSISQSQNASSKYRMLNLSWVLFDFGKRSATHRQVRALLAAANATQNNTLQTVIFNTAQAFYALHDMQASLAAAQRSESIASESLSEASAKHTAGAGTLADELQARTSYRRAMLDRVSAEGDVHRATGRLAVAMGLDANTAMQIASPERDPDAQAAIATGIDQLINEAKQFQPKLAAASAMLDAARANIDAARALGRPTISLVASLTQNNPSYQQQPQSIPVTRSRSSMIGVQLTIPLFEGFASGYRTEQAQAQADAREAALRDAELEVSLDVWQSYHGVQTNAANLANSRDLLNDAERALDIARGRYREGVGTFTELLNAQVALADAEKQRVSAVSKWRTARLKLAASLGRLTLEDKSP
ncbi:TolC family protein [Burkholderia sp. Nafp2/4-1b]|uniref:TolC family protein n=1 Tax=Burkholderia sp. Nafp2/4-1b TaxID=2116686 RepID=UPI000EF8738C|nr:TolC family protein [Burkholderia sp. Nafp2/4-1b]RKU04649.1 TolC family protein [Burkholderia sp. Nafp2/4-1b]